MDDNSQLGGDGKPYPKNSTEMEDAQEEKQNQENQEDMNGNNNDINNDDNQNIGEDNNFPEGEDNENNNDKNDENDNFHNDQNDDFDKYNEQNKSGENDVNEENNDDFNKDNNFKDEDNNNNDNNENDGTFRFSEANNDNNRVSNLNNNNEPEKNENDFDFEGNNNDDNNNNNFNENNGGENNNNDDNFGFGENDFKDNNNINNNINNEFHNQYNENDFEFDNNDNNNNNNDNNRNNNMDTRVSGNSDHMQMNENNNQNNQENKSRLFNRPNNSNFQNNNNNNFNSAINPYNSNPNNNNINQNGGTNFGMSVNQNQTTSNFIPQDTHVINNLNYNYSPNYNSNNTGQKNHSDYDPSYEQYEENPEDNDGFHIDPSKRGKDSSATAGAQIANTIMGAGILSIPIIMSYLGFLVSFILIVFLALCTIYSVYILIRCHQLTGKSGYSMFGKITMGKIGTILVKVVIIINNLGICIAYFRIFGETFQTILQTWVSPDSYWMTNWHNYIYIFLGAIIMMFFIFIKNVSSLKKVAYLGVLSCLIFAIALSILLLYKSIGNYLDNDLDWDYLFPNCTFTEAFHAAPTVFVAFLFQFSVFPIYYSMKHRSMQSMLKATRIGVGFSLLIFLIVGTVGFLLYGFEMDDTILESLADDMKLYRDSNIFIIILIIIICITFIITCLTSFPILFLSLRVNFINSIIVCIKSCGRGTHSSQEVKISQSNNHKKRNYINNKAMVLITILLYFFIIATAIIIYRIRTVFTIVGITAGTFIAFILPNLFYIGIVKRSGKNYSLVLPFIFLGIGIFFFVIGVLLAFF